MTLNLDLSGQRVLIVGGARDIGLALAEAVTAAGATAIVGARGRDRAKHAASLVDGAEAVQIDITDESAIVTGLAESGRIDHIVVTTSAHHNVAVTDLDHDLTVRAFDAKIIGPLLLAKHAAPLLPPGGSIVLFSGLAAWTPTPGYAVMAIANGAVSYAATHLAKELAPIRVNAISPGIIDSGSWDSLGSAKRSFFDDAARQTLAGRVGRNVDISTAVVWLLTADFVTGETIHVEGGARI